MGLFYTTFTVYGSDRAKVMAVLKKARRCSFVSPKVEGFTVVYDRESEAQDFDEIENLGKKLSESCGAPVLAAALHDDDVLYLWLFQDCERRDFYNSLPQYFDPEAEPGPPEGGDSSALCEAFAQPMKREKIEELLRANLIGGELSEISGEHERHQALLKEFGMPAFSAGVSFSSIEGKYVPKEFQNVEFELVV